MDEVRNIKLGKLTRSFEFDRAKVDDEQRTVELSFSSEAPVERWFGFEILDHEKGSVDLSRMASGAPLLMGHSPDDQVGVIEKAWIQEKKGRALVRFGRSQRANEIFQDVKDGIRRLVSVGYRVYKMVTEKVENDVETLRAMRWQPMEVSIVSIPADPTVGVGRSDEETEDKNTVEIISLQPQADATSKRIAVMSEEKKNDALEKTMAEQMQRELAEAGAQQRKVWQAENAEAVAIATRLKGKWPEVMELLERFVRGEMDLPKYREEAFNLMKREAKPIKTPEEKQLIGMNERDLTKWSWARAIMLAKSGENGFEREVSNQAYLQYGQTPRGPNSIMVPMDVLLTKRDQLVATGSLGGNVVQTQVAADSFIDVLRNRIMVARAGATMLTGLRDTIVIPRQTGASATTWASSEAAATSEASVTFDQVTLSPKQISSRVDYSWLLLQQSNPSIDNLIRNDFMAVIARAIDLAALHGTGSSGQPTGVAATSGIGSVTGGSNGANPTWGNVVGLETEVSIDNADIGALAYLTNAKVRGRLKQTLKGGTAATDGIYIWPDTPIGDGFGTLNGYRIGTTNQVSSALTKGTSTTICSAIFFGNWSDLLIGLWSGVELLTNPYSQAANRIIETYAYQAVDIAVRHPESFAAMLDALTP